MKQESTIMYNYAAKLLRVVDGDTVVLDVDLGFTAHVNVTFRMLGINAPEVIGTTHEAGLAAKIELERLMTNIVADSIRITSQKPLKKDKYGRWLAVVTVLEAQTGTLLDVNQTMINGGFAIPYNP